MSPFGRLNSVVMFFTHETDARNSIIRIPFTGSVKLRSLLLKSGPGDQTPAKVALVSGVRNKVCF